MWVVKLGGSLAASPHLPLWLEALGQAGGAVVPGGGPFADAVRQAQARWGFDDATAHHMAILAMNQYGRMLAGLCPGLRLAATLEELQALHGQAAVWLPDPETLDAAGIPASWDITSDSLAAWLARRVGAADLLLVKSALPPDSCRLRGESRPRETVRAAPPAAFDLAGLANQNWVDPVFPAYAAQGGFRVWLCGPDGHRALPHGFAEPDSCFAKLSAAPALDPLT